MAKAFRSWVLRLVSNSAADRLFQWRHQRRWKQDRSAHEEYFAGYQERVPIVDAVIRIVRENNLAHPRVFEFGCSGGNNLRLLRERLDRPVQFCGIDIQEDAIAFARQHFPDDQFHVSAATTVGELPTEHRFDIFLASGVLLYLAQGQAQKVLTMAGQISAHQVICDMVGRFSSPQGTNEGTFVHPFGRMCAHSGLQLVTPPYLPSSESPLGIFTTRTAEPQMSKR